MTIMRLREVRLEKGLSQDELATISGVSRNLIAKLECGLSKNTSLKTLEMLAAALQCKIDDLFSAKDV